MQTCQPVSQTIFMKPEGGGQETGIFICLVKSIKPTNQYFLCYHQFFGFIYQLYVIFTLFKIFIIINFFPEYSTQSEMAKMKGKKIFLMELLRLHPN